MCLPDNYCIGYADASGGKGIGGVWPALLKPNGRVTMWLRVMRWAWRGFEAGVGMLAGQAGGRFGNWILRGFFPICGLGMGMRGRLFMLSLCRISPRRIGP